MSQVNKKSYMSKRSNGVITNHFSQAGTWVDNTKLSPGQRILLRGGNTIGLYTQNRQPLACNCKIKKKKKFFILTSPIVFTVRFPPVFEANVKKKKKIEYTYYLIEKKN